MLDLACSDTGLSHHYCCSCLPLADTAVRLVTLQATMCQAILHATGAGSQKAGAAAEADA